MKTSILFALSFLVSLTASAQVKVEQRATPRQETADLIKKAETPVYDSTKNIEYGEKKSSYKSFVGQEVSFYPGWSAQGYKFFYDPTGKHYMGNKKGVTPTGNINGRLFRIVGFDEKEGIFELISTDKQDTLLWFVEYDSAKPIVSGFYEKMKAENAGKTYKFMRYDLLKSLTADIYTGEEILFSQSIWTCSDFLVLEMPSGSRLSYILKNDKGNTVAIHYLDLNAFEDVELARQRELAEQQERTEREEELVKRFGHSIAQSILAKNVHLKMTKEQCVLALGTPDETSSFKMEGYRTDTWIYNSEKKTLYFENDELTAIYSN